MSNQTEGEPENRKDGGNHSCKDNDECCISVASRALEEKDAKVNKSNKFPAESTQSKDEIPDFVALSPPILSELFMLKLLVHIHIVKHHF